MSDEKGENGRKGRVNNKSNYFKTASKVFFKKNQQTFANPKKVFTFVIPKGIWGISSVGRAFEWHSKGQEFDSPMLHKTD